MGTAQPVCSATPGRVLAAKHGQHVVENQAELPRGVRGSHQQAGQHGDVRQLCLPLHASYFARDDQALHGFAKFFKENSNEEREHAIMFMDYQSSRGGRVVFQDIAKPTPSEWGTPLEAVEAALELEKTVNQSLLDLHAVAGKKNDPYLSNFIEDKFLDEQVKAVQQLSELVTKMKRAGVGLGVHIIDKEMA